MPEQHIIINDTNDDILPLAWGVKGGNVIAHNLTIKPAEGTSNANISITNASINSEGDLGIYTNSINNRITIGGAGSVSVGGAGSVFISTSNNINISSGSNMSCTTSGNTYIGSGQATSIGGTPLVLSGSNLISLGAGEIQISTGNFGVTGPATFVAPATFKSATIFNSSSTFNNTATFNDSTNWLNNASVTFNSANGNFIINSAYEVYVNSVADSYFGSYNGNLQLSSGGSNGTTTITGGGNGVAISASKLNVSAGNFNISAPTHLNYGFNVYGASYFNEYTEFSNNSQTVSYGNFRKQSGTTQYISNQVTCVNNTSLNTANFSYNTRFSQFSLINTTSSMRLVNPNLTVTAGSLKLSSIVNSDNSVFTNLKYIDDTTIISNNTINITYTSSEPMYLPFAEGEDTILESRIANIPISGNVDVDTLDDNTVVEFNAYTEYQGVKTPYKFNENQDVTLYVGLFNNNDEYHNIVLIQGYNDNCLDDSDSRCFVNLKSLLTRNSSTHLTNIVLDSTWKFRIIGLCGNSTKQSISGNVYYEYHIYEPKKAGSGGGSSINEDNLYTPYSNLSTYAINDMVIYNNILYRCIVPITVPESFDSSKWVNTSLSTEVTKNTNSFGGLKLVQLTQQEYDALTVYDNHTLYVIANVMS